MQRSVALLDVAAGNRICRQERNGCCSVCTASDQCANRCVGCGTQESAEHVFLSAGFGGLSLVHTGAPDQPVCCGRRSFLPGTDGQASSHHATVCLTVVGLLASEANGRCGGAECT